MATHDADLHPILCLNSGSSSLKFALYHLGEAEETRLAEGAVERIGLHDGHLWIRGADEVILAEVHRDFPAHIMIARYTRQLIFPAATGTDV